MAALAQRAVEQPGPPQPAGEPVRKSQIPGALAYERAVSALLAGMVALAASGPISDNSLLTHLATGRLQVVGGLPSQNPFLTTSSDFPVPSWWWSAALGWTERIAGLGGVRLFTVLVAGALGWVLVRSTRPVDDPTRPAVNALSQALPAAVVLVLLVPWLNGRPHLGGFVLFAVVLVVWRERRSPWWLVPVFAVWLNVHGSWLYGLVVLGVFLVSESLEQRSWNIDRLRWIATAVGGVVLGGVFYPERFRLVLLPSEQLGSAQAREAVRAYQEWRTPDVSQPWVWIFAMVGLLAFYGVLKRASEKQPWGARMLAVGSLTAMGLSATRLLPLAAMALAAFAAAGIDRMSQLSVPPRRVSGVIAGLGAVALLAAIVATASAPHTDLSRYPVEEIDWLAERNLVASGDVRVIHNDWVGNYMEFRFGEQANAWVDDRPSVQTLLDHAKLRHLTEGWEEALERADPDVVLWQSEDELPDELAGRGDWITALTTDDFRVLCHARIASRCR